MALTSVDEIAAMLRWGDAEKTKFQGDLAPYIGAASAIVEDEGGPFEERTVEYIADGQASLVLPYPPASIESVQIASDTGGYEWVDGYYVPAAGWDSVADWTLDKNAGILYGAFPRGRQNVKVTFTVGYAEADVPDAARLAATMIAVDKWAIASQRAPSLDDGQPDPIYLLPRVVRDLLAPYKKLQMSGFA